MKIRFLLPLLCLPVLAGCIGTPKQLLRRMGAEIIVLDETRAVRISMRGKKVSGGDLMIATALCFNHPDEYSVLRELDLSNSTVSDEALEMLKANAGTAPGLQLLDLTGTQVSDRTVAALQVALPGCRIVRKGQSAPRAAPAAD